MITEVLDEVKEAVSGGATQQQQPILAGPRQDGAELPRWFLEQRQRAWRDFTALPAPTRKDQAWRFSNVNALDLTGYRRGTQVSETERADVLDRSVPLNAKAGRLVFADDCLLERDVVPDSLRKAGVVFQPLERALLEHEDLVHEHFMTQSATLGSARFAALHAAQVCAGAFVYVPPGVEVELPIEIFHWLSQDRRAVFPHLLLVADDMAKVTVIEHFRSLTSDAAGFACGVNDLIVGRGASVRYACVQRWNQRVTALQINATTVQRDASAMSLNLHLGGAYSRFESLSRLLGEGARSDLLAVAVAEGGQEFDARTLQDHVSPHTTSDLLYKNALTDRARTTFGGLIRVEPHAHFTDAYQTVRNLLLSDDAEANSMPGLEILADNVKCSHGATSGQIDEDELFYLLSRGISRRVAQQLIVTGFLDEVIARLKDPGLHEYLAAVIAAKFAFQAERLSET